MKKLFSIFIFLIITNAAYAQNTGSPIPKMDEAVKSLAENINKALVEQKAGKFIIGQFTFQNSLPPLSVYWVNQLTGEITNIPRRSYTVLSGGTDAEWMVTGEFVEAADIIRVYTRLIRMSDRAIMASFNSSFERSGQIGGMLSSGSGSRSSSTVAWDAYESDSWDNPLTFEIGADENAEAISRTIHNDDEDFFLLLPDRNGRLTVETLGSTDTYMNLYNADTKERLSSNDDGGSGYNARISYNVQAGKRYLAKVNGCDDSDTGAYSFRAYLPIQVQIAPDEYEPDNESNIAKTMEAGTRQQRNFHNGNDVDWVKFQAGRAGRYIIRTRGVNSNRLDTCIELFSENLNSIAKDDDGGDNLDSRISMRLDAGVYFLKVWCLDDNPDQPYTLSIEME